MTEPDVLGERLRATFEQVAALPRGELDAGPSGSRPTRRRRSSLVRTVEVVGVAVVVLGAALSIALSGASAARPVLRLASYSFHLPSGFAEEPARATQCWIVVGGVATRGPAWLARSLKAASSRDGACIVMMLSAPYTPAPSLSDPVACGPNLVPTTVDGHQGYIAVESMRSVSAGRVTSLTVSSGCGVRARGVGTRSVTISGAATGPGLGSLGRGSASVQRYTRLYVELRLAHGRQQDLAVGANGLSDSQLVSIVAKGLKGSPS